MLLPVNQEDGQTLQDIIAANRKLRSDVETLTQNVASLLKRLKEQEEHGLENDTTLPKKLQVSQHSVPYEVPAGQVLTSNGAGGATFEAIVPPLHTRLHEMDEPLDHDASSAANKAKYVQSNATTGAIEFGHKFNDAATTPPSVTDDSTAGYSVGSKWINTTTDLVYTCTDASAGAANWDYMVNSRSTSVLGNLASFTGTSGQEIQDSLIAGADVTAALGVSHTQNTDTGTTSNTFSIDSDSILGKIVLDVLTGAANKTMIITNEALTDDRVITLPNATGTVALTGHTHVAANVTDFDTEVTNNVTVAGCDAVKHTQHTDTGTTSNTFTIDSDSVLGKMILDVLTGAANKSITITNAALTDDRVITLPDATGTVSLTGHGHVVADISDFDTEVSNNVTVAGCDAVKHTQGTDTGTTGNTFTVDSDSTTGKIILDVALGAADKALTLTNSALTDNRTATFQDLTGTVELTGHTIVSHAASEAADKDKYVHSNAGTGAIEWVTIAGGGDVTGPAGAVDGNVCAFDGVTGKTIKDSGKALTAIHTQNTDGGTTEMAFTLDSDSTTGRIRFLVAAGAADRQLTLTNAALTDNRTQTIQDATGTIELTGHTVTSHAAATGGDVDKYIHSNAGTGAIEWVTGASINTNKLMVSVDDSTPDYLEGKLIASNGITLATTSGGGDEERTIAVQPEIGSLRASTAGEHCEFFNLIHHWNATALASGTVNTYRAAVANHPGILMIRSHATNANSGGVLYTAVNATAFLLAGYEVTELVFKTEYTSNLLMRFGFQDSGTTSAPTDGAYIDVSGTTLQGICVAATSATATGSTYTISASTWYRAKIVVNSNATRVDFYLYSAAGAELWTNNVTATIPTAAGQETGHGVVAYNTNPGSQREILDVDYLGYYYNVALTR